MDLAHARCHSSQLSRLFELHACSASGDVVCVEPPVVLHRGTTPTLGVMVGQAELLPMLVTGWKVGKAL